MGEGAMANHALSWRNRKTLILSRTDMMGLLTPAEYVACVEQAYRMHGEGRFVMEPKGHIVLDKYPGEWEAMPSYIEEPEAAACKWVSIREQNRERFDLPTVFSILIYTHPETGFPLAICDGSHHTVMRTGAAAAVSAMWPAPPMATALASRDARPARGGAAARAARARRRRSARPPLSRLPQRPAVFRHATLCRSSASTCRPSARFPSTRSRTPAPRAPPATAATLRSGAPAPRPPSPPGGRRRRWRASASHEPVE